MRALSVSLLLAALPVQSNQIVYREGLDQTLIPKGFMWVTAYQSVPEQTDNSPFHTSTGERTNRLVVAVSQDQLCKVTKQCRRNVKLCCKPEAVHYGDVVKIEGIGYRIVADVMHERHKNRFDVWVASLAEEKRIPEKKRRVWIIR